MNLRKTDHSDEHSPPEADAPAPHSVSEDGLVNIGTDAEELRELADAVVRGASITHARIADLRALVEAVQAHPEARLAKIGEDGKPTIDNPTSFNVLFCVVDQCDLSELAIGCMLRLQADFAGPAVFKGASFAGAAWFVGTRFVGAAGFGGARFAGAAGFTAASFAVDAVFDDAHFVGAAWFGDARFAGAAGFGGAHFAGDAGFEGARFAGAAWFGGARFAGAAWFGDASFVGAAGFGGASFAEDAEFEGASFAGAAGFPSANFAEDAVFEGARFAGDVGFRNARFGGAAGFGRARFVGAAGFEEASFANSAVFEGACFAAALTGDCRLMDLRKTRFAETAQQDIDAGTRSNAVPDTRKQTQRDAGPPVVGPVLLLVWMRDHREKISRWMWREFGWKTVRNLGQIQFLTRVSIVALIAVPVLAALWPAVEAIFVQLEADRGIRLSASLALAFFAAAFVTVGQLAYQSSTPPVVRKHDEDEFADDVASRYQEGKPERNDGLRRAMDNLAAIAQQRPDRHPNLVSHHGETVWIPPRERLDWFEDATIIISEYSEEEEEVRRRRVVPQREGYVPGAERARIALEEGARAEYWLISRQKLFAAWTSFILYMLGMACLLFILVIQALKVGGAAGWW